MHLNALSALMNVSEFLQHYENIKIFHGNGSRRHNGIMERLNPDKLPRHVAVIMDGNGRWAKKKGLTRIAGHQKGIDSVRDVVRTSRELGIRWLTLYAFSEENWKRPKHEVKALMNLLNRFLKGERKEMLDNGIRLTCIGLTEKLPPEVQRTLWQTIEVTSHNKDMTLALALNRGD
jgi:undecaprenyl diphosphate synthase